MLTNLQCRGRLNEGFFLQSWVKAMLHLTHPTLVKFQSSVDIGRNGDEFMIMIVVATSSSKFWPCSFYHKKFNF